MRAKANMSWITQNLATGGDLSFDPYEGARQVEDIVTQGITCVIDMRAEDNDAEVWASVGIDYLHLPTTDADEHHIPASLFDAIVDKSREVFREGGKVLVHCHMGINRGPSGAYAVLLGEGRGTVEAFDLIRMKRREAGLYYAMDALKAHLDRQGLKHKPYLSVLQNHINKVWTPTELRRIQHVIRAGHRRDSETLSYLNR